MLRALIMAAILLPAPPSARATEGYCSYYAPEVAQKIMCDAVDGESHDYLDYNGDGQENVADAVGVLRRYESNIANGNSYTLDRSEVMEIALENVPLGDYNYFYYQIDGEKSVTVSEITTVHVYCVLKNTEGKWTTLDYECIIDPYKEIVHF